MDRYLTGKETEPWEIIYFKLYKGQLSVVEHALEIAALMLGSDKSRGYSLEMIAPISSRAPRWRRVNRNRLSNPRHPEVTQLGRRG